MHRRINHVVTNTLSFQESITFSKETPHSLSIKHFSFDENVPLHYASTIEILLADHIQGEVVVCGEKHSLDTQDVVVIPPSFPHATYCRRSPGKLTIIKVNFDELKFFLDIEAIVKYDGKDLFGAVFVPELFPQMSEIALRLIREDGNIFSRMHCMLSLFELLAQKRGKSAVENTGFEEPRLYQLIQWTHHNYSSHITLDQAAKQMNMSKYYFCKYFKSIARQTYLDYLNQVRIYHATQMLRAGMMNITECSLSCGYESVSYFIQLFKRSTGYTPKQFIKLSHSEMISAPETGPHIQFP